MQTSQSRSTEAARQYYQDHPQQSISYNAFKSPVEIREHGKERISFQYNAAMGRSHMYYGGEESDKTQRRFRKHYSADGSMEIKEDTETSKTTFVTYIGGDAYGAPLIWHSEQGTTTTTNYYYLHRDYLGSILGITDKEGNFKEKRHFDAWGNIVKLTDGAGAALQDFVILDRGYTGHEHLAGVGLVHMNGRLYDPVLHRFLMPDNYVQDPYNTQNFNRYGYVLNNPLMYIDPSGESIESSGETGLWGLAVAAASVIATWGDEIKSARIGRWLNTNIGKPIEKGVNKYIVDPIRRLFGGKKKERVYTYTSKTQSFSHLEHTIGWQNEGFGGGSSRIITVFDIADFFGGIKQNFNQGLEDRVINTVNFVKNDIYSGDYWGPAIYNFGTDFVQGRTMFNPSNDYLWEVGQGVANMSVNDWAYAAGYSAPDLALSFGGGYAFSSVRFASGVGKPFVQFSSMTGRSKAGQRVFSFQARFPRYNLNIRLDRGFRAPFKNVKSSYIGEPYNGFNTHINIQKPGVFNYHYPLNPLKWKYYNIP